MPYTPGPWIGFSDYDKTVAIIPAMGGISDVCIFSKPPTNDDARLILAAPDMLEALKAVIAIADRRTVEFDRARAAVAKATVAID